MLRPTRLALAILLATPAILASAPAAAQLQRSWVSSTGNNSADCSQATPCKTFAGAYAKTAVKGEINCVDSAGYRTLAIDHSISILCDGTQGRINGNLTNAILINTAGPDSILLSGLDITGSGNGTNGIRVTGFPAVVHIRNSVIHDVTGNPVTVSEGVSLRLILDNVLMSNNGTVGSPSTGGIAIVPNFGGYRTSVTLDHVRVINGVGAGLRVDTSTHPGTIVAITVDDSAFVNNAVGIQVKTGTNAVGFVTVRNSHISGSAGAEILANGAGALVTVSGSELLNNTTSLIVGQGGQILSYGDNLMLSLGNDGAFTGTVLAKK